ncbi:hypothetical protein [Methylorubrum extorquens]|uniref:Uncharacterized protein n=1 Tax=Methylorubrum extorquens DSM 13060 TaxID=882800 RepID=H1KHR1_METEX|nr:hypothetical protein [Methylorubrum extorquens]EHP92939.1 hypothetical protein MetexDRAFT_2173 [Methylorubrum extorquens DSM 13060]
MRLVSEQSEAEIALRQASSKLTTQLRALTANLMRISRGAGAPHQLAEQMTACLDALASCRAAAGHGVPSYDLQAMLNAKSVRDEFRPVEGGTEEDWARWEADGSFAHEHAVEMIRRAALQLTASMLVNQPMHVGRAEGELYEGARQLEAARDKGLAYHRDQVKARRKPRQ